MAIKFPFGKADVLALVYAAALAPAIINTKSVGSVALTGDLALNLQPDAELMIGSEVSLKITADGTNRTVTPGANHIGAAIAVNATKIVCVTFIWDGSKFLTKGVQALN